MGYLPPEHFLGHQFRRTLDQSCREGRLSRLPVENVYRRAGSDGKLLLRLQENPDRWVLEEVVVTLQQPAEAHSLDLVARIDQELGDTYRRLQAADPRWGADWSEVHLLVNPNGPMVNAGSDADNGQTGRKLVMDYYGPRVPIGGGALCGKDLRHIDRAGAHGARQAALHAVKTGARECQVTVTYAPNHDAPRDVNYQMSGGRGERWDRDLLRHSELVRRINPKCVVPTRTGRGEHFLQ